MTTLSTGSRRDVREEAAELARSLPEGAGWDDVMEAIYVRQSIEAGLADADAGRVVTVEEVRMQFGLEP